MVDDNPMFSILPAFSADSNLILFTILTFVALLMVYAMIVIIEVAVLQIMRWGEFRSCLKAGALMNIVSFLVGFGLMLLVPKPALWHLFIFMIIATLIEGIILGRFKPGSLKQNWLTALIANLASLIILLVPAFMFQ